VRGQVLRPVLLVGLAAFAATTLVFPVATTWGTFLHAAGPAHVLLVISALLALDTGIARLGARQGWTRPVAWLGGALGVFGSLLFSATLLPSFASASQGTAAYYGELAQRMASIGRPLDASAGPVITDFPIWMAESERIRALALPDETAQDVLDLAQAFPGTHLLVVTDQHGRWPAILDSGAPGTSCFRELNLGAGPPGEPDRLASTRVFEIVCQ